METMPTGKIEGNKKAVDVKRLRLERRIKKQRLEKKQQITIEINTDDELQNTEITQDPTKRQTQELTRVHKINQTQELSLNG